MPFYRQFDPDICEEDDEPEVEFCESEYADLPVGSF